VSRALDRRCNEVAPEAIIEVPVLWAAPVPFFTYRDLSWDQLSTLATQGHDLATLGHPGFTQRRLEAVRARENAVLRSAAGAIVFSKWAAEHLVSRVGLDPDRVHVVPPGVSATQPTADMCARPRWERPPRRLLFVGRDFRRKAGELTVSAFVKVRRALPDCTLTVIGPDAWPLRGPVPDGVDFRGRVAPGAVGQALADHDLFVMPSWFEPFGIAFAEALTVGMPCIARDAFAAPEIIEHGRTGLLTRADNAGDLADVICAALTSETLFESTAAGASEARAYYSWARAGAQIGHLLRSAVPTR
jgi:glycosyltransferase involved in cell wall biosynthesis